MKSFLKLLKVNYRNNYIGYIIIGILLLIPIAYCTIQTYNLYDAGYSIEDVDHLEECIDGSIIKFEGEIYNIYNLDDLQKVFPSYVGWTRDGSLVLFSLLNIVVMITIFILSRRNRSIRKFKVAPFTILSLIVYGVVLSIIEIWFDCVTATIFQGFFINTPHFTSIYFLSLILSSIILLTIVVLCVLLRIAIKTLIKVKRQWVLAILILIYAILFLYLLYLLGYPIIFIICILIMG